MVVGQRILTSFWYYRELDMATWRDTMCAPGAILLADSGAFTAFTQGKTVRLDQYAAWLERNRDVFTAAFTLDVIGDPVATAANTRVLLDANLGVDIIPIFHAGSDWAALDAMLDLDQPYVALGGTVPLNTAVRARFIRDAFARIPRDRFVHGLGLGKGQAATHVPWYSIDSSVGFYSRKYGRLALWDAKAGRWRAPHTYAGAPVANANHRHRNMAPDVVLGDTGTQLRQLGIDPAVVIHPEAFGFNKLTVGHYVMDVSMHAFEQWHQARHGVRYRPNRPDEPGLMCYCVAGPGDRPIQWTRQDA